MSDSDSNPAIPSWQKAQSDESNSQNTDPAPTPSTSTSTSEVDAPAVETTEEETTQTDNASDNGDKLEVARRFLENDAVRDAPHEKKVEFLKSKGIDETEINALLGQEGSSEEKEVRTPVCNRVKSSTKSCSPPSAQKQPVLMHQRLPRLFPHRQPPNNQRSIALQS